ncbi:MAG: FAD binding domain-containing protein [Anaerolineales bacterium]
MQLIRAVHRPDNLDAAVQLLARPDVHTAALAGGTSIVPQTEAGIEELVDLQAVGLDAISRTTGGLAIGATVRVQSLVEDERVPDVLRAVARQEGPNTFRNVGTVGGAVVAADWQSVMLAALLALQAEVNIRNAAGERRLQLSEFLSEPRGALDRGVLTEIAIQTGGTMAVDQVARTPADTPIVGAVARRTENGAVLLALSGVAVTPMLVDPDQVAQLDPPGDFRGSGEYRREMAVVLSRRVLEQIP